VGFYKILRFRERLIPWTVIENFAPRLLPFKHRGHKGDTENHRENGVGI